MEVCGMQQPIPTIIGNLKQINFWQGFQTIYERSSHRAYEYAIS